MFISKEHLQYNLGVEARIAAFFVDRKVPVNNAYWKGRLLYISRGTGYLFIPLFFDLQFKAGLPLDLILENEYVELMESILDSAALHEFGQLSFDDHIARCKDIMNGRVQNESLFNDLVAYFGDGARKPFKNLGTFSMALNRGDSFLFLLASLKLPPELVDTIISSWYALVPSFLLMDDIMDLRQDRLHADENSINDFGPGTVGVEKAIGFLREKFGKLKQLNGKLGEYFEGSLERKLATPYLQSLLTNQTEHGTG